MCASAERARLPDDARRTCAAPPWRLRTRARRDGRQGACTHPRAVRATRGGGPAVGRHFTRRGRGAARCAAALLAAALYADAAPAADVRFGLGTPATAEQIAGWDIDVRPDGHGLPRGQGTARQGEDLYARRCAACHGEFGEGRGRFPALMGGQGTLASQRPVKTIGSFWPYASTLFDYIRRAQPFGHGQSLSHDEVYALTAYLLNLNDLVGLDEVLDAARLTAVRMPNRDGFVDDDRPDVPSGEPCMRACRGEVSVTGRASEVGVTPRGGTDEPQR